MKIAYCKDTEFYDTVKEGLILANIDQWIPSKQKNNEWYVQYVYMKWFEYSDFT